MSRVLTSVVVGLAAGLTLFYTLYILAALPSPYNFVLVFLELVLAAFFIVCVSEDE